MDVPDDAVVVCEGPRAALRRVGHAVGAAALPGDVVALVGELGAGKTFLAQAIARGAGVPPAVRVTSPSFPIVQRYAGRLPVFHADLYRLAGPRDVDDVGLFDQGVPGLVVVEWPERHAAAIPAGALWVYLERTAPLRRRVRARGEGAAGARLLAAAREAGQRGRGPRA